MKDLIGELLNLHKSAQIDRSKLATLHTEHESVLDAQKNLIKRCEEQHQQISKLQEILGSRNAAVAKELGLHTAYQKSLQQLSGKGFSYSSLL